MSGIIGGINLRSSGLVNNSSASDGQILTGTGAGLPAGFEAAAGGGKVLDVRQSTKTDTTSTTSTTATTTGLTVTTGTLATTGSKVLVQVSINIGTSDPDQRCQVTLWDADAQLFLGDDSGAGHHSSGWAQARSTSSIYNIAFMYLDSPGATTAQVYTVQFHSAGSTTSFVNRCSSEDSNTGRTASSITAIEIGA